MFKPSLRKLSRLAGSELARRELDVIIDDLQPTFDRGIEGAGLEFDARLKPFQACKQSLNEWRAVKATS